MKGLGFMEFGVLGFKVFGVEVVLLLLIFFFVFFTL